jgi:hypothetical protein
LRVSAAAATVEAMIRAAVAVLGLALLLPAAGGASSASGLRKATRDRTAGAGAGDQQATAARKRRRRHRRHRSGCSRYCRQAGGFGAGPDDPPGPVRVRHQRIRVDRFGQIGVRATCARDTKCSGVILVDGYDVSYGRADLVMRAHKTRKVWIDVPRKARRYLKRHGPDRKAFATVALKDDSPVSISDYLTLLPRR